MRLGPGPVFAYEWLTTTRRWQLYAMRAGFVALLLIGMVVVWQTSHLSLRPRQTASIQILARYGESLYKAIVSVELTLVLLVAPAATAGAICLDKARGTLDHMLATDLSNAEIVLGKIGVRLVPVLGLVACALPIMALTSLLGGIDPTALFGSFLTAIACAVVGCSVALILSVWGQKTHEVLMSTYMILILWLLGPVMIEVGFSVFGLVSPRISVPAVAAGIDCSNPYYLAFAPYEVPGRVGMITYLGFLGSCLLLSTILLTVATRRVRIVALSQAGRPQFGRVRWPYFRHFPTLLSWPRLPASSLDRNPILWLEWHRSKPSRFMKVIWITYMALGIACIAVAFQAMVSTVGNQEVTAAMCAFQVSLGLLLLSVNAATSLAEERVRGSLDVLLCTPLSTGSILVGKWWGSFRQCGFVVVWPAILGGMLFLQSGRLINYVLLVGLIVANCAVITSLGLLAATVVSRLGRAVAVCVSAYVLFSIGWVVLSLLAEGIHASNGHVMIPMVMGSPPYGAGFGTMVVGPGESYVPGGTTSVGIGAVVWIVIDSALAILLFVITTATFDRCLGRVSETPGRAIAGPRNRSPQPIDPDFDQWITENAAAGSRDIRQ